MTAEQRLEEIERLVKSLFRKRSEDDWAQFERDELRRIHHNLHFMESGEWLDVDV